MHHLVKYSAHFYTYVYIDISCLHSHTKRQTQTHKHTLFLYPKREHLYITQLAFNSALMIMQFTTSLIQHTIIPVPLKQTRTHAHAQLPL